MKSLSFWVLKSLADGWLVLLGPWHGQWTWHYPQIMSHKGDWFLPACAGVFGRFMGRKINSWNWLGTRYGIELVMSHKMLNFKAGIDFSFPAYICHIVCLLEVCWPIGVSLSHRQHMTTTILKSSILSHGINVSKNQFHNGIYFSHGIDSVESKPGVLKSLIIRARFRRIDAWGP